MDITKMITDALSDTPQDKSRGYIGASTIGKECSRAIWYDYHGAKKKDFPAIIKTAFDVGKCLESLLLNYLANAGLDITRPNVTNDYLEFSDPQIPVFKGHLDAFLKLNGPYPVVVEIKTAKASSFNRFQSVGLRGWSMIYYAQMQAYLGMTGYKRGLLLALNKDSSALHHEWVESDPIFYCELKEKAKRISEAVEAPERINKSPLYFVCAQCEFKETCFSEGNHD